MACEFIRCREYTAKAKGVLHARRFNADEEKGPVAMRVNLGNPDGTANVEAVVVLMQRIGRGVSVGESIEIGVGVPISNGAVIVLCAGCAALHNDAASGATIFGGKTGDNRSRFLHVAAG